MYVLIYTTTYNTHIVIIVLNTYVCAYVPTYLHMYICTAYTDLVMKLHIYSFAILIDHLEGMGAVAVHVTVAIRNTSVTK